MKKEELIEKIKNLSYTLTWNTPRINREIVIDLIEQLDEPQKPVVPQFVADWYEENKDSFDYNLWEYLTDWEKQEPSGFKNWISNKNNAFQTLVNMHQFGYTVEKEKRYLVKVMNIYSSSSMLKRDDITGEWFFGSEAQMFASSMIHTRKELEQAGFGEVFNSPLFEVEEVEE